MRITDLGDYTDYTDCMGTSISLRIYFSGDVSPEVSGST